MLIIFVGLDRAGKSSIKIYLETLDVEKAKNTKMSNGLEVYKVGDTFKIEVFPGQEKLRYNEKLYQVFFPPADKIFFIFDAADKKRFNEVTKYFRYIEEMINKYCNKKIEVILVAHKQDIEGAIKAKTFFEKHIKTTTINKISFLDTSIYDPFSLSNLLKKIHGTKIDNIVEALRRLCRAELAFLYDGHILPISYSPAKPNNNIITHINQILIAFEKIDKIEAFAGYFKTKNIAAIAIYEKDSRIIIGVYGFKLSLRDTLNYCKQAGQKYISEYRDQMWG